MEERFYPIRATARLTRLTVDTLRAWERRYGVVSPQRRNGVRLYSQEDVERLVLLREALERGHSIGQAARMSPGDLKKLVDVTAGQARTPKVSRERDPLEVIIAAVENFDYREADLELGRIVWLTNPRDVVHRVALPLMRLAGQRWHDQRIRVAHEHLLTQLLANLMGSMIRVYAPVSPPARVMTATLSGDLHAFGVLAASMLVISSGLAVVPLGPDLPPEELAYAAKRSRTRVVLVSLTSPPDPAAAARQVSLLATRLPRDTELWVGLNPPELARRVTFQEKKIRTLTSFEELEHELKRIGGRF